MHSRSNDTSFVEIEDEAYKLFRGESIFTNYLLHFLKILRGTGCAKIKIKKENDNRSKNYLVEGWSIKGCVPKMVELIVMNVGLLILHTTKVLILW